MQQQAQNQKSVDILTLAMLSAMAYLLATFLHEIIGHGLNCALAGGHIQELGAFYASCDYTGMSDLAIRWDAFAGPLASFLTGVVAFVLYKRTASSRAHLKLFLWLLGTLGFMVATGYLLFSGISGLGDFGVSRDGVLYQIAPEWLWRILETLFGAAAYVVVVIFSARQIDDMIGGSGVARVTHARRIALVAYLTGAVVSLLISLLNPLGPVIILTSAAAASLGGTSGLLWMMQVLDRKKDTAVPFLRIPRSWPWIIAGVVMIVAYAAILGPTLRL